MKSHPNFVNLLKQSVNRLYLIVCILTVFCFAFVIVKFYRTSILSKTDDLLNLKRSEIIQIVSASKASDSSAIALNHSLHSQKMIHRFLIFNSKGELIHHYFRKEVANFSQNLNFIKLNKISSELHFKAGIVAGPIRLGGNTIAHVKVFFSNDLLKKYIYLYLSIIVCSLILIYLLFLWILIRSASLFTKSLQLISSAMNSMTLDSLGDDKIMNELKEIIATNRKLIVDLKSSQSQLNEAALVSQTDIDGKIIYVNDTFCQTSMFTREELMGEDHNIVSSGEHSKEYWDLFWNTIQNGHIWRGEVCNKAKDGSFYWVQSTVLPIFNASKEITGYTAIRVDITAKKEAERLIQHQSRLASLGEMAAGVGHEINNPLTISAGQIELIKKEIRQGGIAPDALMDRLNRTEQGHKRIRNIVDGLRTYARSDTDHNEVLAMKFAIDQTVNLISEIYEKEGVKILLKIPNTPLYTRGSLGKLQQIMMNLISNAKDATENCQDRIITLALTSDDPSWLKFSVTDNGIGMPANILNKILHPFFTTKNLGKGTGMGLGVVSELLKTMQGSLNFTSTLGQGSCFTISLPAIQAEATATIKTEQEPLSMANSLQGSALVVDDEQGIRELLIEHLEDMGLKVDEADDGDTALAKVKIKKYDYICTDMKMLRMQGEEFIKQAKQLPFGKTKYFIISGGITTNYSEDKRIDLRNLADGFINKPFSQESIYLSLIKK